MDILRWAVGAFAIWFVCVAFGSANAADLEITFGEVEEVVRAVSPSGDFEVRKQPGLVAYSLGTGVQLVVVKAHTQNTGSDASSTLVQNISFGLIAQICLSPDYTKPGDRCYQSDEYRRAIKQRAAEVASEVWRKVRVTVPFDQWRSKARRLAHQDVDGSNTFAETVGDVWTITRFGGEDAIYVLSGSKECPFDELIAGSVTSDRYASLVEKEICPLPSVFTW